MDCPVCGTADTAEYPKNGDKNRFDCKRCGEFDISGTALATLPDQLRQGVHRAALLSHDIRRMSERKKHPFISTDTLDSVWKVDRLPPPQEQSDDLILLIGDSQLTPEQPIRLACLYVNAWIGASLPDAKFRTLNWHLRHLYKSGLLESVETDHDSFNPVGMFQLTMSGWNNYAALKKVQNDSKVAFMAMKFGDEELNRVVSECFKPAVAATGFTLRLLTDGQGAGLIDDQLRAAILQSRFILADLSHSNNGAYWEAGFAEGLNLPVIYTCKENVWKKKKTHFDTNHMNTIIWHANNLNETAQKLKATIRATLRHEAKQED